MNNRTKRRGVHHCLRLLFCPDEHVCPALRRPAHPPEGVLPQCGGPGLCGGDAAVREGDGFHIGKGNLKYLLRSAAGTIGIVGNFYAVDHLAQSDASMLNKMSPFCVILFSYLILKEKLTHWQVLAVITAFLGSLFVIKLTFSIWS